MAKPFMAVENVMEKVAGTTFLINPGGRYGTCPMCGAMIGIYSPKGGDGSTRVMRIHKSKGKHCKGSRMTAIGWE